MRKLALLLVACSSKSTDCPPPPKSPPIIHPAPELRLPDDAAPVRYRAKLEIDPRADKFTGHIEIDVTIKHAVDALWLNAHELTFTRAVLKRSGSETTLVAKAQPRNFVELRGTIAEGAATLVIDYSGPQQYGRGQGMGRYFDAGDDYVVTHFEPAGARRVFPSFDEPSFKVPWQLEIITPAGETAFTNTPVVKTETLADGRRHFTFAPTQPLPSYLIALAVGKFDTVDAGRSRSGVEMRILVPRARGADATYAAGMVGRILAALEDYTGIPYPYEKLDHVAVPGTQTGAMEHPGLVTYGPRWLLIPDGEGVNARRGHLGIVAHELAHQWFGDLVTTAWWDDLWLNEAFATWLAPRTVDVVDPAMDAAIDPIIERGAALAADAFASARKIRQPIVKEADMRAAFDGITYAKGATVIGMFEQWIGRDAFRTGARNYLHKHAHGNATATDFLAELTAVTKLPVAPAFATYLDQPGVPQIDIKLVCDGTPRLELAQKRFVPVGGKPAGLWHVPICVRAEGRETRCTLLDQATGTLALDTRDDPHGFAARQPPPATPSVCPRWVIPNAGGVGYYLANLPADLLEATLAAPGLARAERLAMFADLVMLIDGGHASTGPLLAQLDKLGASDDPHVVELALERIEKLARMVGDDQRDAFARLVRDVLGKHAVKLGWLPRKNEPVSEAKLRSRVMSLVAVEGADPTVRAAALGLARQWLGDPKSLPESAWGVVAVAVRIDPKTFVPLLVDKLPSVTDRVHQRTIYGALAAAPDLEYQKRVFALLDGGDPIVAEKLALLGRMPETIALQSARFDYVRGKRDDLVRRIQPDSIGVLLAFVCDASRREDVTGFLRSFASNPDVGEIAVAHQIEAMNLCISRREAQAPVLAKFLADRYRR